MAGVFSSVSLMQSSRRVAKDGEATLTDGQEEMSRARDNLGYVCSQEDDDAVTRLMNQTPRASLVDSSCSDELQVQCMRQIFKIMPIWYMEDMTLKV